MALAPGSILTRTTRSGHLRRPLAFPRAAWGAGVLEHLAEEVKIIFIVSGAFHALKSVFRGCHISIMAGLVAHRRTTARVRKSHGIDVDNCESSGTLRLVTKDAPKNVEEVPLRREAGAESHERIT